MKIMTVDLEPDLRSNKSKSVEIIVPKLLDYFKSQEIKATFFTVSSLFHKHEDIIKEISKKHEIASHSHTHSWLNDRNASFEISHSKKVFENYGFKIDGFRAPKFITTKNHFSLLEKAGYKYDSSFNGKFAVKEINGIKSINFPVAYSGLTVRKLFHPTSKFFPESKMFYLHPWEFLKKEDLPKSDSLIKFLLKRNTGKKAWEIFTKFIEKDDSTWVGCRDWIEK